MSEKKSVQHICSIVAAYPLEISTLIKKSANKLAVSERSMEKRMLGFRYNKKLETKKYVYKRGSLISLNR